MNQLALVTFIFPIVIYSKEEQNPIKPLCFGPGKTEKRCCSGYRTLAGQCHICNGTFGLECSKPCPDGYFGLQCLNKCQCATCNAQSGSCIIDVRNKPEREFPWKILVSILSGLLVLLMVLLVAAVYQRKRSSFRPYQAEHVTTDAETMRYESIENATYLECNPSVSTEMLGSNFNNLFDGTKTNETDPGYYVSVNQRPPSDLDTSRYIKETVKEQRKGCITCF